MLEMKYIRTSNDVVVIFPELLQHKDFKEFNPKSAGFIRFMIKGYDDKICKCYGESISLGLKSFPEDSELATKQFITMGNLIYSDF